MVKSLCDRCRQRNGRPYGASLLLCDPCIAAAERHLTCEQIRDRYPRLIRALKWSAILSNGEAEGAIRDHRDGFGGPGFGCEAVAHVGGPTHAIRQALRSRHHALAAAY